MGPDFLAKRPSGEAPIRPIPKQEKNGPNTTKNTLC